ncbi:hypothetical protein DN547_31170, partial [Burkholderia multivorans]
MSRPTCTITSTRRRSRWLCRRFSRCTAAAPSTGRPRRRPSSRARRERRAAAGRRGRRGAVA